MRDVGRSETEVGVLVADLCGFAALTEALGDEVAADVATRFVRVARRALPRGTRIVKTMGDAVLVVARSGAEVAVAAERVRDGAAVDPALPPVHVGVAAGPVAWRGRDVFGATVNTASRLAEQAGPSEILLDGVVGAEPASSGRRRTGPRRGRARCRGERRVARSGDRRPEN